MMRCLLWTCLGIAFLSFGHHAVAQLPDEKELPGADRPASDLPDERILPGQEQPAAELPDERVLPGQPGNQEPKNESAPIGGEAPILRLAFDGHTAQIKTIDLSDDGQTLVTAGDDKELHVWRRSDISKTGWMHRRTIRWPVVQRGPRGQITSARLKGDLVSFAGYGAFGALGEIRIASVATGKMLQPTLMKAQDAHRQNIISLAWSPAQDLRLASLDLRGRVMLWSRDPDSGLPVAKAVFEGDSEYGDDAAARIFPFRNLGDVAFNGPEELIVPHYVGDSEVELTRGHLKWHLRRYNLAGGEPTLLSDLDHIDHVRALTVSEKGRVIASCDGYINVGVWKLNDDGTTAWHKTIKLNYFPLSLDLDESGTRLLIGTQIHQDPKYLATVQLWDVEANPPKRLGLQSVATHVYDVALDLNRRQALVAQGRDVHVYSFDQNGAFSRAAPKRLTVPVRPVRKIAMARDGYQIGLGWTAGNDGNIPIERVFDLSESKLLGRGPIDDDSFLKAQRTAQRWQYRDLEVDSVTRSRLYEGEQARGLLPLTTRRHGLPTALATLPVPATGNEDAEAMPQTGAVIVGTMGQCHLYAYRADATDPPELIRQFRGHSGAITSLCTTADNRYLVSAAEDSLVAVWNLQDLFTASKLVNQWGAEFEIEGNRLIATDVREDGPLYFRGVRGGDELTLMVWRDGDGNKRDAKDAESMRRALINFPFDQMVVLDFERRGRQGPKFQSYPAWRPLAMLFVDDSREWAYWTPAGYYDASFNGHQKFGWQINNDQSLSREVDFFRAAQFRRRLERGDVMRRLLSAGNLPAAMRQTVSQIGPPPGQDAIVNQLQNKPRIELLAPDPRTPIDGDLLTVQASVEVPAGATLVDPKAFVSGVPAVSRQIVGGEQATGLAKSSVTYQWQFRLPSDQQLQLEIVAATEAEAIDRVLVDLTRKPVNKPAVKSRLHILAIGVSQYDDPQIQSLDFAAGAAGKVIELFREKSSKIYETSGDQLVNNDATRPMWRVFASAAVEKLRSTVSPDDLVIMYLCGHGLRDRRTNQWYFVTADARYSDLMNDQYDDCIAFSDLAALASLPCRKLAILDSCHSGAVQPLMRRGDLKSALRFLQDDVVLTVTASEGDEEAAEQRETRMGRFTTALVAALRGEAPELDDDPTTVSLREAIDYVTRRVSTESEQEGMGQHPTASPNYLLRTLRLPLTSR